MPVQPNVKLQFELTLQLNHPSPEKRINELKINETRAKDG